MKKYIVLSLTIGLLGFVAGFLVAPKQVTKVVKPVVELPSNEELVRQAKVCTDGGLWPDPLTNGFHEIRRYQCSPQHDR